MNQKKTKEAERINLTALEKLFVRGALFVKNVNKFLLQLLFAIVLVLLIWGIAIGELRIRGFQDGAPEIEHTDNLPASGASFYPLRWV